MPSSRISRFDEVSSSHTNGAAIFASSAMGRDIVTAIGSAARCSAAASAGHTMHASAGTATNPAPRPVPTIETRAPIGGDVTPWPRATTIPAASWPETNGGVGPPG